jgi:hypothetical protein
MQCHSFAFRNQVWPTSVGSARHQLGRRWVTVEVRRLVEFLLMQAKDPRAGQSSRPHYRDPFRQADPVMSVFPLDVLENAYRFTRASGQFREQGLIQAPAYMHFLWQSISSHSAGVTDIGKAGPTSSLHSRLVKQTPGLPDQLRYEHESNSTDENYRRARLPPREHLVNVPRMSEWSSSEMSE